MERVSVRLDPYFTSVTSTYGHDPAAWQNALAIYAVGLARLRAGRPAAAERDEGGRCDGGIPASP